MNGLDDTSVKAVSRAIAATLRPKARCRSVKAAMVLAGVDVLAEASVLPLIRWARELWDAAAVAPNRAIPSRLLVAAWINAAEPSKGLVYTRRTARGIWARVKGPMSAAIASGCHIGWDVTHPLVWVNERGEKINLLDRGPALVERDVREAVDRMRLQEVARASTATTKVKREAAASTTVSSDGVARSTAGTRSPPSREASCGPSPPGWCGPASDSRRLAAPRV